jgi:hypothetical protein
VLNKKPMHAKPNIIPIELHLIGFLLLIVEKTGQVLPVPALSIEITPALRALQAPGAQWSTTFRCHCPA